MTVQVKLEDIVDGMEMASDNGLVLINMTTGEVVYLLREFLRDAEEEKPYDGLSEWVQEQMIIAYDVLENEQNYVSLPSQFDINEYGMMEEFCYMQSGNLQDQLLYAIHGKGAFRRFKDKIYDLDLEDDWYEFRDKSYQKIAIEFCKELNLKYV